MQYSADFKQMTGVNDTTLLIQREGKAPVRLDEGQNLVFLSFDIEAPTPKTPSSVIPGLDGAIDKGTTYGPRSMTARFFLIAEDKYKLAAAEAQIMRLFDSKDYFQIIDEDRPLLKWEKVKLSDKMTFDRQSANLALVTIPMGSYYPYALFTGNIGEQAALQGVPPDGVNYLRSTSAFSIWNLGDTDVDPCVHDLIITFKGASTDLKIENLTTGDSWTYTGSSVASDVITLDTVFSRKNGFSIFVDTDHGLITLAPGENQIRLTGATDPFTIQFEFPTYYF